MSANQGCSRCGWMDYTFMPCCHNCGELLDLAFSPAMVEHFNALPLATKRLIQDLGILEVQMYVDGVSDFQQRWNELKNIAYQLAFGIPHDKWIANEFKRMGFPEGGPFK